MSCRESESLVRAEKGKQRLCATTKDVRADLHLSNGGQRSETEVRQEVKQTLVKQTHIQQSYLSKGKIKTSPHKAQERIAIGTPKNEALKEFLQAESSITQ